MINEIEEKFKIQNPEEVVKGIRKQIKQYVEKNKLKSLIVGVSGGLDSSAVSALCQSKYTGVPLIGVSIPIASTDDHMTKAEWVGHRYCDSFQEFHGWQQIGSDELFFQDIENKLSKTDEAAKKAGFNPETFPKKILSGNMKARLRMITLYDLARKTDGLVLSTDNLSEFLMGFWTLHGDVGDLGPIQKIGKGYELPQLAQVMDIKSDIIEQQPSDGLMVTEDNTDEAQLGANYKEIDQIMFSYLGMIGSDSKEIFQYLKDKNPEKVSNIVSRYNSTGFKRTGSVDILRDSIGLNSF